MHECHVLRTTHGRGVGHCREVLMAYLEIWLRPRAVSLGEDGALEVCEVVPLRFRANRGG